MTTSTRIEQKSSNAPVSNFVNSSSFGPSSSFPLQTEQDDRQIQTMDQIRTQRKKQESFGHDHLHNISFETPQNSGYLPFVQRNSTLSKLRNQDDQETDQLDSEVIKQVDSTPPLTQRQEDSEDEKLQTKPIVQPQLTAEPIIQSYRETTSVSGMGSGAGPSSVTIDPAYGTVDAVAPALVPRPSYLEFAGRLLETSQLAEDTTAGRVNFHLMERADINNMILNDFQWGTWDGVLPFSVNSDQVTFATPIVNSQTGGSGATMTVNVNSASTPVGGYATFAVTIAGSGSTSVGGGIGVGPISASAPVTGTTNFAGGLTRTFTVNLRTTPPRPISGPDVSFRVGSARLEDGQEGAISAWFNTLSDGTKDAIRNGRRTISISGYASTTSRRSRNRDLSEQRARVVERILRGHAGSSAVLNVFFFGEDNSTTPDETEDPRWRRATIQVQTPSRQAPRTPG
jgi:outer membrane protein OmpA-like peptidoglycan-associated protein